MVPSTDNGPKKSTESSSQLRFFQGATALLLLLLVAAVGFYEYRLHSLQPVTILVNGSPVATVESLSAANSLIRQVHSQQVGQEYLGRDDPRFVEDVEFRHAPSQTPIDSMDAAASKLSSYTHTVVDADVILVDAKKIVALPDEATAQAAVDELRQHYAAMPPINAPLAEKPTFAQTLTIDRRTVPASLTKTDADDAAAILWTPPAPRIYTVQPHETGWSIAKEFKLSFGDFLRANAGHDVNRLAPGDSVVVSKTFPPVDVIVKKQEEVKESFGGTGVRQLTVEATYIDGVLTGTPIAISMTTLQRATPGRMLE